MRRHGMAKSRSSYVTAHVFSSNETNCSVSDHIVHKLFHRLHLFFISNGLETNR